MSSRLYLQGTGGVAPDISPAKGSMWAEEPAVAFRRITSITKANTSLATGNNAASDYSTVIHNFGNVMYVSGGLSAQTISGTLSAVIVMADNLGSANTSLQVTVRVVSADGLTERGVLYGGHTAALTTSVGALGQTLTSYETRIIPAGTVLTPVTTQANDRLVIEFGGRTGVGGVGGYARLQAKDLTADADYPLTAGLASSLTPWVELSQTVVWGGGAPATNYNGTATLAATATLTADGTVAAGSVTNVNGSAALAETATLAGAGTRGVLAGATLALTAALVASGVVGTIGAATLPATATLTASGAVSGAELTGTATLPLTATLTAAGVVGRSGQASLPLTATLTAAGSVTAGPSLTATLPVTVTLVASGTVGVVGPATLPAFATLAGAGVVGRSAGATLAAVATLTASGHVIDPSIPLRDLNLTAQLRGDHYFAVIAADRYSARLEQT